jgi:hypothetical protein
MGWNYGTCYLNKETIKSQSSISMIIEDKNNKVKYIDLQKILLVNI